MNQINNIKKPKIPKDKIKVQLRHHHNLFSPVEHAPQFEKHQFIYFLFIFLRYGRADGLSSSWSVGAMF